MIIGISILVAFATVLAYRRRLELSSAFKYNHNANSTSSSQSTSHLGLQHPTSSGRPSSSVQDRASASESVLTIMWTYLCTSIGLASSSSYGGGGPRGGGGFSSSSLGSSISVVSGSSSSPSRNISSPSPQVPPPPEMVISPPQSSPDSTPKVRPIINGSINGSAKPLIPSSQIPTFTLNSGREPEEEEEDNDEPPAFPALNSSQRAKGGSPKSLLLASSPSLSSSRQTKPSITPSQPPPPQFTLNPVLANSMPPPPHPSSMAPPRIQGRNPRSQSITLSTPPSSASLARGGLSTPNRAPYLPGSSGGTGVSPNGGLSSIHSSSSPSSSLRLPPSTTTTIGLPSLPSPQQSSSLTPPKKKSTYTRKIILEPGHSPLDWARLTRTSPPSVLLGPLPLPPSGLLRLTPSQLAKFGRPPKSPSPASAPRHQVLTSLHSKIYNITAYLPFHPGGETELLRCAGRDGTELFMKTHSWVNVEGMLGGCLVGVLVGEDEGGDRGWVEVWEKLRSGELAMGDEGEGSRLQITPTQLVSPPVIIKNMNVSSLVDTTSAVKTGSGLEDVD